MHLIGRDLGGLGFFEQVRGQYPSRIHYHGSQPHTRVYPVMQEALAIVLPSLVENLPNSAIEALALGTPVIATKGVGVDELLCEHLKDLSVPPEDPPALAEAMMRIASMPTESRSELGQIGRRFVQELWTSK